MKPLYPTAAQTRPQGRATQRQSPRRSRALSRLSASPELAQRLLCSLGLTLLTLSLGACHYLFEYTPSRENDAAAALEASIAQDADADAGAAPATQVSSPGAVVMGKEWLAITAHEQGYAIAWVESPALTDGSATLELWLALISAEGDLESKKVTELEVPLNLLRIFSPGEQRVDVFTSYLGGSTPNRISQRTIDLSAQDDSSSTWTFLLNETSFPAPKDVFLVKDPDGLALVYGVLGAYSSRVRVHWLDVQQNATVSPESLVLASSTNTQAHPRGVGLAGQLFIVWQENTSNLWRTHWLACEPANAQALLSLQNNCSTGVVNDTVDGNQSPDHESPRVFAERADATQTSVWISWKYRNSSKAPHFMRYAADAEASWKPAWVDAITLISANRFESLDFACASSNGFMGVVWESDTYTPTTQIRAAQLQLEGAPPSTSLQGQVISDISGSTRDPKIAARNEGTTAQNSQEWGVVFIEKIAGQQAVFFKKLTNDSFGNGF